VGLDPPPAQEGAGVSAGAPKDRRRGLSHWIRKGVRDPIRNLREPLRRLLLKLTPGFSIAIESPSILQLAPFDGRMPSPGTRCLVNDDARIAVRAHPLSRNSSEPEARHYVDHEVVSPGLSLDHPGPHYWFARSGVMISPQGRIWPYSLREPLTPETLRKVKCVGVEADGRQTFHPGLIGGAPRIAEPSLLVAQSDGANFGHFLLDVAPVIALGQELGARMLSWPLKAWQRDIVARLGVGAGAIRELPRKVYLLDHPVISNRIGGLGVYLAHPGARKAFDTIRANVPVERHADLPRRFYLMRGPRHGRVMRNRVALAEALKARGITPVQPELLGFDEQVALFSRAELVVAEFGAALANVVFCPPGAKILEIIIEGQDDAWSAHLCAMLALEHVVQFQTLSDEERRVRGDRFSPSPDFAYTADVAAICAAVDRII
jgi:hypothetical protein